MSLRTSTTLLLLGTFVLLPDGLAQPMSLQSSDLPKREFRGAWIASVTNLDWPNPGPGVTINPSHQMAQLTLTLDRLRDAAINAVFFQIRPESDALYESSIEPWSYWLTGQQGRAPNPLYDPLSFAIQEAHRRGMELHAWFNPYRVERRAGSYPLHASNVARQHPEWVLTFGNYRMLDPGIPEVRDYVINVVTDVVTRYDIDGVHFDDFFYPYPPNEISNEDAATYATYGGSFTSIADWRRWNVDTFVEGVQQAILAVKPEIKFGISPFGIWKSGVPGGIIGLSAYDVIYVDAPTWMSNQWLDYLTPQLYWAFGGQQDYARLAPWWASKRNERHLYVGHGLYKSDRNTYGGTLYNASEVPRQVRFNREREDIAGGVFFRSRNITHFASRGFADSLKTDLNRYPALVPTMDWKDLRAPGVPEDVVVEWIGEDTLALRWSVPSPAEGNTRASRFAVYRIRSADTPDFGIELDRSSSLFAVTGDTMITDRPVIVPELWYYVVTAVSPNSVESIESNYVAVEGRRPSPVGIEDLPVRPFELLPNHPNPFSDYTDIEFSLSAPGRVRLAVYDVLGREVSRLAEGEYLAAGGYSVTWDGRRGSGGQLAAGAYFCVLDVDGVRAVRPIVKAR